ncbi:MAG: enoyl-CoA hydratase/isomerase family protein, partial [Bradymonadaceae bacterium]
CHDVFPLTDLLRQAYRAVNELDMMTVAAVHGSCYGCGVEFVLNCDHRLVADSGHTQFYMTELADYLNTPAFGSTQRLVRIMPLPEAVDFLMWGKRLRAEEAVASGLASAVLPWQNFEESTAAVVDDILAERFE